MNIYQVFEHKVGTLFRIPETEEFEEEFVSLTSSLEVKFLIYNETGRRVPLTEAYLKAEYIKEN